MIAVISSAKSFKYFRRYVINYEDEHKFFNVTKIDDIRGRDVTHAVRMHGSGDLQDINQILDYCRARGLEV